MDSSSSAPLNIGPPIASRRDLTRTQQLIWASQRLHPGVPLANMGDRLRISGPLDPDRFVIAFDAVVRHAEALRLVVSDGATTARILRNPPATTEVIDLPEEQLERWSADRIATPIDPTTCVYDSVLLRHGDDDWTWWIDVHHLAADAWSAALVIETTAAAYAHEGDPHDADLAAVAHADFSAISDAITQLDPDDAGRSTRRVAWAELEAAVGPQPPLTLYGPRGPRSTSVTRDSLDLGAVPIEELLSTRFRSLTPELGRLTLAAMATLITVHRLDGRPELVVGVPVHHRSGPARRAIGPLMELYPLRLSLDPDETHQELFRRTLRDITDLLARARPGESPDTPFEIVLNVTTAKYGDFAGRPARREWMRSGHVDPNHVVRVQVFDHLDPDQPDDGRQIAWELDVNDELSTDGSHRALARHFAAVMTGIVDQPDGRTGRSDIVGADERRQLALLNPDPDPRDHATPVHEQVRAALRADPDWIVADDGSTTMSAAEFDREADRAASALRADGLAPGQAVGLRMPRSIDVLVGIHAVLRAGGRFVMLDPADPPSRHEKIRSDADLFAILDRLPETSSDQPPVDPGLPAAGMDHDAYILYTSGSTGEPKGVPISHRGLADYLAFAMDAYASGDDQAPVVALHSSLAFDLTITSLFLGLLTGGRTVIFPEDPVEALGRIAADDRITFLKATPSQLEILTRVAEAPLALRTVVVGGEAFRRPVAERLRLACADPVRIFNEYGPTEAVVGCMIHAYDAEADRGVDVPIGAAAPGTQLLVLDPLGQLTPPGSWGELYVRRFGMATQYLNRPELSEERFLVLPGPEDVTVLGRPEGAADPPWYRTGDRVRVERPGVLVYGGRNDDQVKVNGIRLEPAEVEAALVGLAAVDNALVRVWRPEARGERARRTRRCERCGLGTDVPGLEIDADGVCSICHQFDAVEPQTRAWFRTPEDLDRELARARSRRRGDYDCLHLLSGGKDSTYALYQLVERGWKVHALTLDNGFIAEGAKENIRRSIADLDITHEFVTTEAMNEIFRDSLERHANVCQGCYKTIYTLAVARADALGIPTIVTGLSRGQFFETRLIPHQFEEGRFDPDAIDRTVLEARHVYHHTDDAVTRLLPEQAVFDDEEILDRIEFVDFYRYVDVELAEMYDFLEHRAPWVRPDDTGRSTNCLINIAGIRTHLDERGYHNYAEPYSWDVRLGHKTRDEALEELDDEIDEDEVERLLAEVGYEPDAHGVLTAWYQTRNDADLDPDEIRTALRESLPEHAIPAAFVRVEEIPLAASAKVDTRRLPAPTRFHRQGGAHVAPRTPTERRIAEIWADVLALESVGVTDDFFDIGGASLAALEVAARIDAALGTDLPDAVVFRHRTIAGLADTLAEIDSSASEVVDEPGVSVTNGPVPLSAAEEAMLFEYRSDPGDTRYNGARHYTLRGPVDPQRLEDALRDVVMHHPPLHTTFDADRTALDRVRAVDWTDLGSIATDAMAALAADEVNRPFDLDHGPLVRVHLARTADDVVELLITMPHIVSDAGSFDTFWRQVAARADGIPLPVLPVSYAEHSSRQRLRHRSGPAAAFWSRRSEDRSAPRRLGFAAPVPPEPDGYLERTTTVTAGEIKTLRATPFATALAALATVVSTHTGSTDVEIGVTVSTKDGAETESIIGCYLNTITTMLTVAPDRSFAALVADAATEVAEVLPHRTYPFASVVRDAREAGRPTPDISVILAYEHHDDPDFPGATVAQRILTSQTAVTDATFFVHEAADGMRLGLEYRGTTLTAHDAGRLLDAFADVFEQGASAASSSIDELTDSLRGPDLHGEALTPDPALVLQRIVGHIRDQPHAPAVADAHGRTRSYAELGAAASALASRIESRLDDPESLRIGISVGRSVDLVVALLAAQLAGGAHVVLDPAVNPARVERIAARAGIDLVVTDDADRDYGHTAVVIGADDSPAGEAADLQGRVDAIRGEQDAYVIYTSGSTGEPRGVAVTHANLAASTGARDRWFSTGPRRFLVTSSAGFDSAMVGLYWPLATGGTVVVPTDDDVHDIDRLTELIAEAEISHVLMVPSLARALLDRAPGRLQALDMLIVAGEVCPTALADRHFAELPGVDLVNEYGPTEATVWATAHHAAAGEDPVPIGRPIPGTTVRIADELLRPVPSGIAGELLIAGPGVTAGYLDSLAATAERFVSVDGRRWYRTGDIVRETDGVLLFLGRNDDQLNVGGVRVEPTEIERELDALAGVTASVVVAAGSPAVLVAHVETSAAEFDEHELRRTLGRRLPATMVPRRLVAHESLPRTPHGKLDRSAAARLDIPVASAPLTVPEAGHDATVQLVTEVWRTVLDDPSITATSDFFDVGGDSLSAVAIVTAVGDQLDQRVPIATLLSAPTPAGMAALLEPAGTDDRSVVRSVRLRPGVPGGPLVLMTPAWDDVFGYQALAEAFPEAVEIVALVHEPEPDQTPITRVPELVDEMLDATEHLDTDRAVAVLGWSIGGVSAVELTAQRHRRGERVDMVALVDTFHPGQEKHLWSNRWWKYKSMMRWRALPEFGREVRSFVRRRVAAPLGRRLLTWSGQPAREPASTRLVGSFPAESFEHRPTEPGVPLIFYRATTTNPERTIRRWRELTDPVIDVEVDGRHRGFDSIMDPGKVEIIAADLAERLLDGPR